MWILYLCLVVSQTPVVGSPANETVKHDGTARLMSLRPPGSEESRLRIQQWVSEQKVDEVKAELIRLHKESADNRAVQIVTMSELVAAVGRGQIEDPVTKNTIVGRKDDRFRSVCRPYVDEIVLPELSIPAAPELLEAQIDTLETFWGNAEEADWARVRERPELRKEYVRRVCLVWARVIKSCLVYRENYPEDIISRETPWPLPQRPAVLKAFAPGSGLEDHPDPAIRKAYLDYRSARRAAIYLRMAIFDTVDVRRSNLKDIVRPKLEYLYGEDRTKWDELRQIVTETVKDPDIAKLVLKDFTQRKEPGVWPIGPKPESGSAPTNPPAETP